ncbi:MAG: DNA replication/repair protein RecF [Anaerolineae bacterium]|nr:DNA replication/repair protein RecF [Thermoflexales bacterium]MDW8394756.1 DNA replication/repair protein RecF [Anaerolineae bacterium]
MYVRHLSLTNFRLYARLELGLERGLTVLQGDNAQGKTSLLEALYMLATSRPAHTNADRQVIRWGAEAEGPYPFAVLRAQVVRADGLRLLEMLVQRTEGDRLRKEVRIDRAVKRGSDLVGQLTVVLFTPNDVELVGGAPALRRDFLDAALCQVEPEYARALHDYARALAQRNALLRRAAERNLPVDPDELAVWDEQLAPAGVRIALSRRQALAELSEWAAPLHLELSAGREYLHVAYQPNFDPAQPPATVPYQPRLDAAAPPHGFDYQTLVQAFLAALRARRRDELARGVTLVGPHRDDLRLLANGMDLGEFGSRGQQRTAVLALKLAQAEWMRARSGESPVLLLDEVLAELDPNRRRCLLERIQRAEQVLVTATDVSRLDQAFVRQANLLSVRSGVICRAQLEG